MTDYRTAELDSRTRGMLDFAVKLTRTPQLMTREDVRFLQELEIDDATIHDVVQVTGLFNYYNRLADGLGIDSEPEW